MSKGIRGHVIDLNLSELDIREKDRNSLNNLGGEGIADDISLFINNLKNTSIIPKEKYSVVQTNINGTLQPVIKLNDVFMVPFSNRTNVRCGTIDCVVFNSNTTNSFQLKRKDNSQIFDPGLVDIVRYDAVFTENFDNINPVRSPPVRTENFSGVTVTLDDNSVDIYDINIPAYIDSIDSAIDSFLYLKSNSILTYKDNNFTKPINLLDSIIIRNLDENGDPITTQTSLTNSDPGVFIVSGGNKFRAFSDSSNPWKVDDPNFVNYTSTNSTKTVMAELQIKNPIITGLTINNETNSVPNKFASNFNFDSPTSPDNVYYLPVYINGELFNLLTIKQ